MSPKVAVLLVLVVLVNIALSIANYRHAEAIAAAQLQTAMKVTPVRARPPISVPSGANKKPLSTGKAERSKATVLCHIFGPYKRAVQAAELVNRLQQAGATVVFVDGETLPVAEVDRLRQSFADKRLGLAGRYWVRARQTAVLLGAKPEELRSAGVCEP